MVEKKMLLYNLFEMTEIIGLCDRAIVIRKVEVSVAQSMVVN